MKALVSGQAGLAFVIENSNDNVARVISVEASESPLLIRRNEWRLFLDGATDVQEIEALSEDDIVRELDRAWSKDRGLQLVLVLLDAREDGAVRRLAAECLEELFSEAEVREFVANRLYSSPMPESADLQGAIVLSQNVHSATVTDFLDRIRGDQSEITRRHAAWTALRASVFETESQRAGFHAAAIEAGAFRLFVTERGRSDWALFQLLSDRRFRGNALARKVLQLWAAPFKESVANTAFSGRTLDEEKETFSRRGHERQPRRYLSSREAFEQAEKQRDAIKRVLEEGRPERALKFVEQLIRSQRQTSEPEHIAKSLCDLAQFAKQLGSSELQLEFARRAVAEAPEDAWSYGALGDAYRQIGEYQRALDSFSKAGELGDRQAAMMGRAEVLKDLGELEEALEVLRACTVEFEDNVVARNSEAAAFANFGRFAEALAAYDEILREHPHGQVTRSGVVPPAVELG